MQRFDTNQLNSIPIEDVAYKLGLKLHRNKCLCFLHEENTPSFHIYSQKNIWKCFGCGKGGNVIELVKEYNKYDFVNACKWLSNIFGSASYSLAQPIVKKNLETTKTNDCKVDPEVYKWLFDKLSVTESVREFVKNRKYPDDVIERYNLKGLDDCDSFFKTCKDKWGSERLLRCGLINVKTNRFVWWTNMLLFPYYDYTGENIVYIQGRTLNAQFTKTFKYICLCEIETIPFNLPILKNLKKSDPLVITEGPTDCISCVLMGKNAIGIVGASGFKEKYVEQLKDFDIYVIPDADPAGKRFAESVQNAFMTIGKTINVRSLDGYKDISEYYMGKWSESYGKIS